MNVARIILLFFPLFTVMLPLSAQKAFPTAEGFGKKATGGRGGQVVAVTNLLDDASGSIEGSFRWAVKQFPNEPLTVVFRVSGNIKLVSELKVNRTKGLTIAGQTAPGDGISFSSHKLNFGGSQNFILRNIRSRVGSHDASGNVITVNALGAENCKNFIIDHCTFGWSGEENMNTFDDHFHTVQWCILHEGLYDAGHVKGNRSYGSQWGGSEATYHHNLLASNYSRSCRFNGSRGSSIDQDVVVFIEYINNVNYNWGKSSSIYGGENTSENLKFNGHDCNIINNYYKPGPVTAADAYYFVMPSYARGGVEAQALKNGPSKWHLSGNVMEASGKVSAANAAKVTADNWEGVNMNDAGSRYTKEQMRVDTIIVPNRTVSPLYAYNYHDYTYKNYETATAAYESVLAKAGALPHDACDKRIMNAVRNGLGDAGASMGFGIINDPAEVGGFPVYRTEYDVVVDADKDGIDDAWEIANKLNPADAADRNKKTPEGYTALEVYLNSLMGEHIDHDFTNVSSINTRNFKLLGNRVERSLTIVADQPLSGAYIYTVTGQRVLAVHLNQTSIVDVTSLAKGQYIVVAYTNEGETRAYRFVKK